MLGPKKIETFAFLHKLANYVLRSIIVSSAEEKNKNT